MLNIVAKLWIIRTWKICVTLELTLRAMLRLKLVLQLLFVLEMSRIVKAVTFAFYEDTKCTTLVASPFQGVPNPLVAPLNVCTKTFQVNSMPSYFHQWPNNNLIPHNFAGRAHVILHKTNTMLINISASNIHILECSLHSNSFRTAYVSHRSVRHSRRTAWLRVFHDHLLACCYCLDKSGCVNTGLIVHLHVEISHRENECLQKIYTLALPIHAVATVVRSNRPKRKNAITSVEQVFRYATKIICI